MKQGCCEKKKGKRFTRWDGSSLFVRSFIQISPVVSGVVVLAIHTDEDLLTAAASESGPIASRSFFAFSAWHGICLHDGNGYRKHFPSHTRGALPQGYLHSDSNHSKRGRWRFHCHSSMSHPTCGFMMACPVRNWGLRMMPLWRYSCGQSISHGHVYKLLLLNRKYH